MYNGKTFGPRSPEYLSLTLPQEAVQMVDSQSKLSQVDWTAPIYGIDCEWRPNFSKHEANPVSILTIASSTVRRIQQVFIVDMLALRGSFMLDSKLFALFTSPEVVKVSMGLAADLKLLRNSYPSFDSFTVPVAAYADLLHGYKQVFANQSPGGLVGLCKTLLGKPLCKHQQISDWNERPLSSAQLHYAAMDAHVQIQLWHDLEQLHQEQGGLPGELLSRLDAHLQVSKKAKKRRNRHW